MTGVRRVAPSAASRRRGALRGIPRADALAVAVLSALTALVGWNRLAFDAWLPRFDLFTFFLPWYGFLGERLRSCDVPGWNPSLFSGTPFAGDPESGWMYLPAMLAFTLLPPAAAFKAMVVLQLAIAAFSTYGLARVLGMGATAALVAATVFAFGPFAQWTTYCCLIFAQFGTWIPLALLGVELAARARGWRDRVAPWFVAGLAVSQMFAGWAGEGWIYAVLLVAAYAGYRTLLMPLPGVPPRARLAVGAATVAAALGLGLALGAAGILPRLAVNAETTLAGGDYDLVDGGILNPPWETDYLLAQLLGNGNAERRASLGGGVIVLALLAPFLARRRFGVPFFAGLTLVALTLTQDTTPVHRLFYLIPRYQTLHEHDPWRTFALATIGPALLCGAAVESLAAWRGRRRLLPLVVAPLLLIAVVAVTLREVEQFVGWPSLLAAAAMTGVVALVVLIPRGGVSGRGQARAWADLLARRATILAFAVLVLQPTGLEFAGSWLGWGEHPSWAPYWREDPVAANALRVELAEEDPGGAGAFLQDRLSAEGPFRYVGYGGIGYPEDQPLLPSYMERRLLPNIQGILVNGRPIALGLHEIQGYNPLQLARYAEFMAAFNGRVLDYHVAYVTFPALRSAMFGLLNVRYVLVDATLPPEREDVRVLTTGRREVFRNASVAVFEGDPAVGHAWIVHDARVASRDEALALLTSGTVDFRRTAVVEGPPLSLVESPNAAAEAARITRYEPDAITIRANALSDGLLVVSEVYDPGWRAYVDGERAEILPTNYALRGVPIPAGEHTVEFRYEPPALRVGVPVSATATVAMLAVFGATGWSRVRRGTGRPGRRARIAPLGPTAPGPSHADPRGTTPSTTRAGAAIRPRRRVPWDRPPPQT